MSSNESKRGPSRRAVLSLAGGLAGAAILPRTARASGHSGHDVHTRLSRELGLRVPLASAGMGFIALTDLAAAVSNAGALGVYGVGAESPPVFAERIAEIKEQTCGPFGVDFIVVTTPLGTFTTQEHINIAAAARVPVVVFHWNLPTRAWVRQLQAAGCKVWAQTGDVQVALQAVALGVDGIVAQGRSAGGHNRNSTIPTWRLVDRMRRALPGEIFILAAGGVANGQSLVRAIRAGADGGWAGTVFAAAAESYAHPQYKARLVAAQSAEATQFTTVFGPEFPGAQQRVLSNRATRQPGSTTPPTIGTTLLAPGVLDTPYTMPKHSAIVPTRDTRGDLEEMDMPAGAQSVSAVRRVRSAADIVDDFVEDARDAFDRDDRESLDED